MSDEDDGGGGYGDRVRDFDQKVPEGMTDQTSIKEWIDDRYGHVVGDGFAEGIAPEIANRRRNVGGDTYEQATGADAVWDPGAGAYRDPESGQFIPADEVGE